MKSKRKPNNGFARAERSCRALLRTNHVAVVNIDPSGSQIMANWKSCRQIRSLAIANAIFDFSYRWTIYIGAMCRDERGAEYIKSVEISPEGIYKVERLGDRSAQWMGDGEHLYYLGRLDEDLADLAQEIRSQDGRRFRTYRLQLLMARRRNAAQARRQAA